MIIKTSKDVPASEITDEKVYFGRRRFMQSAALLAASSVLGATAAGAAEPQGRRLLGVRKSPLSIGEEPTRYEDVASYNNFYEFSTGKEDPARLAGSLKTNPWTVAVQGLVENPAEYHLEDFIKPYALEERIYRHRCVEAWSMVIPWAGFPVSEVLKRARPAARAKYVEFTTLYDPDQFPGQKRAVLKWPYVEALRLDEAMHPLAIFAVGLYGRVLPNQNGAPLRLVVPWKYGFKSIKSIVKIRLTENEPRTTWNYASSREYGFYANVNPNVDHPRWSQARERRIGEFLKRKTLPFNGYAEQVAHLYSGMDLTKYF